VTALGRRREQSLSGRCLRCSARWSSRRPSSRRLAGRPRRRCSRCLSRCRDRLYRCRYGRRGGRDRRLLRHRRRIDGRRVADAERLICDRRGRFRAFVGDQNDNQDDYRDDDRDPECNRPAIATVLVVHGRWVASSRRHWWDARTGRHGRVATARRRRRISRARCGIARARDRRWQRWFTCGTVITIVQGRLPFVLRLGTSSSFARLRREPACLNVRLHSHLTRDPRQLHKRRIASPTRSEQLSDTSSRPGSAVCPHVAVIHLKPDLLGHGRGSQGRSERPLPRPSMVNTRKWRAS
jgi:hypothetical protein